ncbi:MAG: bifunctional phosphoglucose/phosphomannose isomerase [Chloroflexi bacterium]|nr:bifunctional phosphoglucose/phosphomannose isomerase [Chloroflexota bacterium]
MTPQDRSRPLQEKKPRLCAKKQQGVTSKASLNHTLDSRNTYERHDPSNMLGRIASLPDQCWDAWEQACAFRLPPNYAGAERVVFLGVGGSAIGGDLVVGLSQHNDRLPVTVLRDFRLPSWVGPSALVVASSYSGNTEETLELYRQARERGACLAVVTGGGRLLAAAQADGAPAFHIQYRGEARSAMGYSFMAPLALLCRLGLLPYTRDDVAGAVKLLQSLSEGLSPDVPAAQNLAKSIALAIGDGLPVVYGAGFLTGAARRWKTQLNENSKSWAFYEELPELAHNSVEGFALPAATRDSVYVVLLHSHLLNPRISARYEGVEEILAQQGVAHRQIDAVGGSELAHLLSSVMLGDYVSYYLAMLHGVNPASQDMIDHLKKRLAQE